MFIQGVLQFFYPGNRCFFQTAVSSCLPENKNIFFRVFYIDPAEIRIAVSKKFLTEYRILCRTAIIMHIIKIPGIMGIFSKRIIRHKAAFVFYLNHKSQLGILYHTVNPAVAFLFQIFLKQKQLYRTRHTRCSSLDGGYSTTVEDLVRRSE